MPATGEAVVGDRREGRINTRSPLRKRSQNRTPDLMVTSSPTVTSFSMKTCAQMLQRTPKRTRQDRDELPDAWAFAQRRTPHIG